MNDFIKMLMIDDYIKSKEDIKVYGWANNVNLKADVSIIKADGKIKTKVIGGRADGIKIFLL